jgi:hypothetical protein
MATANSVSGHLRESGLVRGPQIILTAAGAVCLAGLALALATLPQPLVLPALSLLLIMVACAVALIAWLSAARSHQSGVTYWDIAGFLTFAGICAALLSEPGQVLPLLEGRRPG